MNVDAGTLAAVAAGLNIAITVGGGFYLMGVFRTRLERVEIDVRDTKGLLISAAVDASRLTRAEADIHNIDTDMRNLRKGVGWINDASAGGLNREY